MKGGSLFSRHKQGQSSVYKYKDMLKSLRKERSFDAKHKHNRDPQSDVKKETISSNLPADIKAYGHTLFIVNQFWYNNIQCLAVEELNQLALSIYCHLHASAPADTHHLLLKSNKTNVTTHILKIFTVFEHILRQITASDYNEDSHNKLVVQLRQMGDIHKGCFNDTECNLYELILDAFNSCLAQKFTKLYCMETRFYFTQFYRLIVDITHDNQYLVYHLKQIDLFICSLTDCLGSKDGSIYFQMFLQEQLQDENFLFYKAVQEYKALEINQRIETGNNIIDTYIKTSSDKQVNLRASTRKQILNVVQLTSKMFATTTDIEESEFKTREMDSDDIYTVKRMSRKYNVDIMDMVYCVGFITKIFDKAQHEILCLMQRNSWNEFRDNILKYCANDEFTKQQKAKLSERESRQFQKRNLITKIKSIEKNNEEKPTPEIPEEEEEDNDKWSLFYVVFFGWADARRCFGRT